VADDLRGGAGVGVGERVEGEHDADLDVDIGGGGLPGDPFDEGVGHDLVAGAVVTGRDDAVGVGAQRGQTCALLDRQQAGEHAHGVGRRAQGDPTVGAGLAAASGEPGRVGPVGQPLDGGLGLAQALLVEPGVGELLVHQTTLLGLQVAGERHDPLCQRLADPAAVRSPRVWGRSVARPRATPAAGSR
jgi:hypothetical protein